MSTLAIPDRRNLALTPEEALVARSPLLPDVPRYRNDPSASSQPPTGRPQLQDRNQRTATAPGADNLAALLASLTRILALVPGLKQNTQSRRVVRAKLGSLAARLEPVTSDMQIVYDVRGVISRLGGEGDRKVKEVKKRGASSEGEKSILPLGYAKGLPSSRSAVLEKAGENSVSPLGDVAGLLPSSKSVGSSAGSHRTLSPDPDLKGRGRPVLRRAFSWGVSEQEYGLSGPPVLPKGEACTRSEEVECSLLGCKRNGCEEHDSRVLARSPAVDRAQSAPPGGRTRTRTRTRLVGSAECPAFRRPRTSPGGRGRGTDTCSV